jgi:hypothetical protein
LGPPLWDEDLKLPCTSAWLLFDIMPDLTREVDDLDYLLRGALWSSHNSAPDPARVFAALRTRIVAEQRPVRASWLLAKPAWSTS